MADQTNQPTANATTTTKSDETGGVDQKTVPRTFDPSQPQTQPTQRGTDNGGLDTKEVSRSFEP